MVLTAAFLTQVGALQTAPILIAVVTAFLTMKAVKYFLCRCQPSRQRAQRPGLDVLSPVPFLALGPIGERGEELSERRIRVSQVSLDCAQGPPMAQSQIHRYCHELNQAGQNHSTSGRDRRPAQGRPV